MTHHRYFGIFYLIRHLFRWLLLSVFGLCFLVGCLFWAYVLIVALPWVGIFFSVCIGTGIVIGVARSWKVIHDARAEEELQHMARGRVRSGK